MEINRKCPYCEIYITVDESDQIIECPKCGNWVALDRDPRGRLKLFKLPMVNRQRMLIK